MSADRATLPRPPQITIRCISRAAELRACQGLQRRAFGIAEDGYVVPVSMMAAASKVGGLVVAAYEHDELVGFSFAYLGRLGGEPVLFSQVTAVEPGRQGHGIGRALKLAQRERARAMHLATVAWTFDPLRARNAHFNVGILGATCRMYEADLYGARSDALSAGLATDRIFAEWSTADPHAERAHAEPGGLDLIECAVEGGAHPRPARVREIPPDAERLQVEVPADLDPLKRDQPELARAWQLTVREALLSAFARGFVVDGFANEQRPRYLLRRAS